MAKLKVDHVEKSFGKVAVLEVVDLDIQDGEFIVLLGPSGCGKSTLLRIIAGPEDQTAGSISIGGQVIDHLPPAKRGIAMVLQSYALYPHRDVRGNWALGLEQAGTPAPVIEERIAEAARILELGPLLGRRPAGDVVVGVRPDGFQVASNDNAAVRGRVILNEYLGRKSYLHLELEEGSRIVVEVPAETDVRLDEVVGLALEPRAAHLFDAAGKERLAA